MSNSAYTNYSADPIKKVIFFLFYLTISNDFIPMDLIASSFLIAFKFTPDKMVTV